ncbi:hypothetical protein [Geothermobacter ehrlichii]|uniref:hypothetical protein n=1 Tax=Geothermobacter ehrlichii TaxID=213224 RepID=UPI0011E78E2E|nr:hypothetical protein [Geothermobacter ehrlichii]
MQKKTNYTAGNNTRHASAGFGLTCAPRRVTFYGAGAESCRPLFCLPIKVLPGFKKANLSMSGRRSISELPKRFGM